MTAANALTVLVVYSGRDEPWKQRVVAHLHVARGLRVEDPGLDLTSARVGSDQVWLERTGDTIATPDIVIALVSPHLFSFRAQTQADELAHWFERRRASGKLTIPVILVPGAWEQVPWLSPLRAWPRGGSSLAVLPEHNVDAELAALVGEIVGDDARAETTIEILFLNRKRLRDLRRDRVKAVCVLLEYVGQLRAAGQRHRADAIEADCMDDSCEYAAAARAVRRDPTAFGL